MTPVSSAWPCEPGGIGGGGPLPAGAGGGGGGARPLPPGIIGAGGGGGGARPLPPGIIGGGGGTRLFPPGIIGGGGGGASAGAGGGGGGGGAGGGGAGDEFSQVFTVSPGTGTGSCEEASPVEITRSDLSTAISDSNSFTLRFKISTSVLSQRPCLISISDSPPKLWSTISPIKGSATDKAARSLLLAFRLSNWA